ncbi:MAG: flagellar hook-associated protein FlgK, partial [Nitrospirae bacterium]
MGALFGIFEIGKSGLIASQTALSVVSNNIANVNTPGYTKKEAILETMSPEKTRAGYIGRGVTVRHIRRKYYEFLQRQIYTQSQNLGTSESLKALYTRVEEVFNEQAGQNLSGAMNEYFEAWQSISVNPDERSVRTVLLQKASSFIEVAKDMEHQIEDVLQEAEDRKSDAAGRINTILREIARLNVQIKQIEAGGIQKANDLRDKREALLTELGSLVDFSYIEDEFGSVTVFVAQRAVVDGDIVRPLQLDRNIEGEYVIKVDGQDVTANIHGGQLGGALRAEEEIKDNILKPFRKLMAGIILETNKLHQQGYDLDGINGRDFFLPLGVTGKDFSQGASITSLQVFDQSQLTLHEYEIRFTSASAYEVYDLDTSTVVASGTYTPGVTIQFDGIQVQIDNDAGGPQAGDYFFVSPLERAIKDMSLSVSRPEEIAAAVDPAALPGDNRLALQMVSLYQGDIPALGATFNDYYRGIVTTSGSMSALA